MRCLMVCTANICRSPMAQAVMQHLVAAQDAAQVATQVATQGAGWRVQVDSAGLHGHLAGERPDRRAAQALSRRGYTVGQGRARLLTRHDLQHFDLILAMDSQNLAALKQLGTPYQQGKMYRLLDFAEHLLEKDIDDPYFGPAQGFDAALALCEAGCSGLLNQVMNKALSAPLTGVNGGLS